MADRRSSVREMAAAPPWVSAGREERACAGGPSARSSGLRWVGSPVTGRAPWALRPGRSPRSPQAAGDSAGERGSVPGDGTHASTAYSAHGGGSCSPKHASPQGMRQSGEEEACALDCATPPLRPRLAPHAVAKTGAAAGAAAAMSRSETCGGVYGRSTSQLKYSRAAAAGKGSGAGAAGKTAPRARG
eukprot:scaffold316_cov124-Isochrysis_galbana.AAC.1